jgi:hypothetical protein
VGEGKGNRRLGTYFLVDGGRQEARGGEWGEREGRKSPPVQVTPGGWVGAGRRMESRADLRATFMLPPSCPAARETGQVRGVRGPWEHTWPLLPGP